MKARFSFGQFEVGQRPRQVDIADLGANGGAAACDGDRFVAFDKGAMHRSLPIVLPGADPASLDVPESKSLD